MNQQYSRGCSYNYRRSAQRNIPPANRSGENCHMEERSIEKPLAMGYVPMQIWSQPLPPCRGIRIGTIFADLHKPFCGKGGVCR